MSPVHCVGPEPSLINCLCALHMMHHQWNPGALLILLLVLFLLLASVGGDTIVVYDSNRWTDSWESKSFVMLKPSTEKDCTDMCSLTICLANKPRESWQKSIYFTITEKLQTEQNWKCGLLLFLQCSVQRQPTARIRNLRSMSVAHLKTSKLS